MEKKNGWFIGICFALGICFLLGYLHVDYILLENVNLRVRLYAFAFSCVFGILFSLISVYYFLYCLTKHTFKASTSKRYALYFVLFLMVLVSGAASLYSIFVVGMYWG